MCGHPEPLDAAALTFYLIRTLHRPISIIQCCFLSVSHIWIHPLIPFGFCILLMSASNAPCHNLLPLLPFHNRSICLLSSCLASLFSLSLSLSLSPVLSSIHRHPGALLSCSMGSQTTSAGLSCVKASPLQGLSAALRCDAPQGIPSVCRL